MIVRELICLLETMDKNDEVLFNLACNRYDVKHYYKDNDAYYLNLFCIDKTDKEPDNHIYLEKVRKKKTDDDSNDEPPDILA